MSQFAIKDIRPNPFRHIERYPIRPEKVAALRESLRTTGYWGNIVARQMNGGAEIAYGHHRMEAIRQEYGADRKIDLLVRDLDDDAMLQIMARENMEEWGTSAAVEHETVRAVVEAFAEGRVHLVPPPDKTGAGLRYAPSFVPPAEGGAEHARDQSHPYTAQTIAEFIGWLEPSGRPQAKVLDALAALQYVEEGLLKEADFDGLTTSQARAVITEARKARERREVAARAHQAEAERAARQAAEAQRRREQAEKERQRREAEAAAARQRREDADRERQRREAEAAAARQREQDAERERRQREAEAKKAQDEAARQHAQQQAERAARDQQRAEAERQRAQAQAEQQRRRQQEAEAARKHAQEEADRSERERLAAEASRQQAERRQHASERHAREQRSEGRHNATAVGRAVSEEIKAGRVGYKRASEVAAKVEGKKEGPPPDFDGFTRRLVSDISRMIEQRTDRLDAIAKFCEHLPDFIRKDAATTLRQSADVLLGYADEIWPAKQPKSAEVSQPRLPRR